MSKFGSLKLNALLRLLPRVGIYSFDRKFLLENDDYLGLLQAPSRKLYHLIRTENRERINFRHDTWQEPAENDNQLLYLRHHTCSLLRLRWCIVGPWFIRLTLNPRVKGSNPSLALTSFGKTLIHICHSSPRCKWVP